MASIAVLPILIGLAVDYAIQFQSRVAGGAARRRNAEAAVVRAAAVGAPDDRGRGAGDGDGLPGAAALAGADGSGLWPAARRRDRGRAGLRADGGLGRDGARRPRRGRARRVAARRRGDPPRRRRAPPRRAGSAARDCRPSRVPHGSRCGRRACSRTAVGAPRPRAGDRRRAGGPRLGRGHPDGRPVRRHQARAVEHAGAPRPQDAREGHRRLRRDRRHRPCRERRHAADRGLDDPLRASAADALRLPRDQRLRARDAVPRAVTAGSVLGRHRQHELRRPAHRRPRSTAC